MKLRFRENVGYHHKSYVILREDRQDDQGDSHYHERKFNLLEVFDNGLVPDKDNLQVTKLNNLNVFIVNIYLSPNYNIERREVGGYFRIFVGD